MRFAGAELIDKAETCERPSIMRNRFEKKVLLEWVSSISDLAWMSQARLREICDRLMTVHFNKGEVMMRKGEVGECMYLIVSGTVGVFLDDMVHVATIKANNSIGEGALKSNTVRAATVIAQTDLKALLLSKADYDSIVIREKLQERRETCNVLKDSVFFKDLQITKLERLANKVIVKAFDAGSVIYSCGDVSACMYVVRTGCVKLEAKVKLEEVRQWPVGVRSWEKMRSFKVHKQLLKVVRVGEVFGEKGVLNKKLRDHFAVAVEKTVLFIINDTIFKEDFTNAEVQTLSGLNEDLPDTPSIIKTIAQQQVQIRQLKKALLDGLNYNPMPIGRDFDSPRAIRIRRLNEICKKQTKGVN
jgi:CRP-like cAMP-binding protein